MFILYCFSLLCASFQVSAQENTQWITPDEFSKYSDMKQSQYLDSMLRDAPGNQDAYLYILSHKKDQFKYFTLWDSGLKKNSKNIGKEFLACALLSSLFLNNIAMVDYYYEFGFEFLNEKNKDFVKVFYGTITSSLYPDRFYENQDKLIGYLEQIDGFSLYVLLYLKNNEVLINLMLSHPEDFHLEKYSEAVKAVFKTAKSRETIIYCVNFFYKYDKNYLKESVVFLLKNSDLDINLLGLELSLEMNIFDKLNPNDYMPILYNEDIVFCLSVYEKLIPYGNEKLEQLIVDRYFSLDDSAKYQLLKLFPAITRVNLYDFFIKAYEIAVLGKLKTGLKEFLTGYTQNNKEKTGWIGEFLDRITKFREPFFSAYVLQFFENPDPDLRKKAYLYLTFFYPEKEVDRTPVDKALMKSIVNEKETDLFNILLFILQKNNLRKIYTDSFYDFYKQYKPGPLLNTKLHLFLKYLTVFQEKQILITILNSEQSVDEDSITYLNVFIRLNYNQLDPQFIFSFLDIVKKYNNRKILNQYLIMSDIITEKTLSLIGDYADDIFIPNLILLFHRKPGISRKAVDILLTLNYRKFMPLIFFIPDYENVNYLVSLKYFIDYEKDVGEYIPSFSPVLNFHKDDLNFAVIKDIYLSFFSQQKFTDPLILDDLYSNGKSNALPVFNDSLSLFYGKNDSENILKTLEILKLYGDPSSVPFITPVLDSENKEFVLKSIDTLGQCKDNNITDKILKIALNYEEDYYVTLQTLKSFQYIWTDKCFPYAYEKIGSRKNEIRKAAYSVLSYHPSLESIPYFLDHFSAEKYAQEFFGLMYENSGKQMRQTIIDRVGQLSDQAPSIFFQTMKRGFIFPKDPVLILYLFNHYNEIRKSIGFETESELVNILPIVALSEDQKLFNSAWTLFLKNPEYAETIAFGIANPDEEKSLLILDELKKIKFSSWDPYLEFLSSINKTKAENYSYVKIYSKDPDDQFIIKILESDNEKLKMNTLLALKDIEIKYSVAEFLSSKPADFLFISPDISKYTGSEKDMIFNNLIANSDQVTDSEIKVISEDYCYKMDRVLYPKFFDLYGKAKSGVKQYAYETIFLNQLEYPDFFSETTADGEKLLGQFTRYYFEKNGQTEKSALSLLLRAKSLSIYTYVEDIQISQYTVLSTLYSEELTESFLYYFFRKYPDLFNKIILLSDFSSLDFSREFIVGIVKNMPENTDFSQFWKNFSKEDFEEKILDDQIFLDLNKNQKISILKQYQDLCFYNFKKMDLKLLIYLNKINDPLFIYSYLNKFYKTKKEVIDGIKGYIVQNNLENLLFVLKLLDEKSY